jgi:hypothetical protein
MLHPLNPRSQCQIQTTFLKHRPRGGIKNDGFMVPLLGYLKN